MLQLRRQHAKPPSGGHRFNTGSALIKGETADEVLDRMVEHRAENSMPLGNPEQDLAKYYASIAPHLVREIAGEVPRAAARQRRAENIMRLWRAHPKALPKDSPFRALRKKTCDKCPWKDTTSIVAPDGVYERKAHSRARLLTGNQDYLKEGLCGYFELPLELVTALEKPPLQDPPDPCWMREP